jgi:hypothetical protein
MALLVPDKPPVRIGNRAEKLECTIIYGRCGLQCLPGGASRDGLPTVSKASRITSSGQRTITNRAYLRDIQFWPLDDGGRKSSRVTMLSER